MSWDFATDIILYLAIASFGFFMGLGLVELAKRQSIKKIDPEIIAMLAPATLMAIIYIIFDKFLIVSTRPDGSGEPSFPSSHAMIVATIFFVIMLALPRYISNRTVRIILDAIMIVLVIITSIGRVLADKHYPWDVAAGLVFAAVFAVIYYYVVHRLKKGIHHA